MRMILIGFAVSCVAFLGGCATGIVDITKTAKGYYPPTNANDIEILATKPEKRFVELGSISATGFIPTDTAKMHNSLRAKASPLGADAVLITDSGIIREPGFFGSRKEQWAKGVAIRYEK